MAARTRAGRDQDQDSRPRGGGTDLLLQRALRAAEAWEKAEAGPNGRPAREAAAEQASSCLVTLDAALRGGAPLPAAWRAARPAAR